MSKLLEVGDKVKIIHTSFYGMPDLEVGCIRTIDYIDLSGWLGITSDYWKQEGVDKDYLWCFYPREVELVSKTFESIDFKLSEQR